MNNLCPRAELTNRIRDSIIKACTDSQDNVAVVHRHVRLIEPVHAQHAEELAVSRRISTQAH